ncbi:MAG: DUF4352 domain-containing protein, partial [Dehalococcoidia bacterium]|nr:DUF4352 domain-containing protein [Dehalococcoidia bacterium]
TVVGTGCRAAFEYPQSGVTVGQVGRPATYQGIEFQVNRVTRADRNVNLIARQGTQFVNVEVQVRNTGYPGSLNVSPTYFRLTDSAGRVYDAIMTAPSPALPMAPVPRGGQPVSGFVAFEVPRDAQNLRLSFEPISRGYQPFQVPLP